MKIVNDDFKDLNLPVRKPKQVRNDFAEFGYPSPKPEHVNEDFGLNHNPAAQQPPVKRKGTWSMEQAASKRGMSSKQLHKHFREHAVLSDRNIPLPPYDVYIELKFKTINGIPRPYLVLNDLAWIDELK